MSAALDWNGAACAGRSGKVAIGAVAFDDLFFGPDDEPASTRNWRESHARAICARCPLRLACLDYALTAEIQHGVWGGMTEDARANLVRWRRKKASRDRARERQEVAA